MVDLDLSRLAPQFVTLLNMRGNLVPALRWSDDAHPEAKTRLDGIADVELFDPHEARDRKMFAAGRALLYLWNGHLDQAIKCAQGAPNKAQNYIQGLALRHQGKPDKAKACFQQIDNYGTYLGLAKAAQEMLQQAQHPLLKRFEGLLAQLNTWEPFAFIDLCVAAAAGQLDRPSELIIRKIQTEEFNLLLVDVYRKATGEDPRRQAATADLQSKRQRERAKSAGSDARSKQDTTAPKREAPAKPLKDQKVHISCPKCRQVNTFDGTQRGRKVNCSKCSAAFAVPGGSGKAPAASGVKVACPKCRVPGIYDAAMRGKKVKCKKCSAVLIIPAAKSAA
jgi:ribosomal protein S27E